MSQPIASDLSYECFQRRQRLGELSTPALDQSHQSPEMSRLGGECFRVGMVEAKRLAEIASRKGVTADELL
jgi:hypothetical protein